MTRADSSSASRRAVLGAGATLVATAPAAAAGRAPPIGSEAEVLAALQRYQAFGDKASGGPGDLACGAWLEGELKSWGYAVDRQEFDVPAYEGTATLAAGRARADLIPQAIVVPTSAEGLAAPLFVAGAGRGAPGGIALVVLPHARWSTAKGEVERRVKAAFAEGAAAAVVVTTGPTGEACALNTPIDAGLFDRPVAVLAPREAQPFLEAARSGESGRLTMSGRSARRPAWNLTASLARGGVRTLVISTPRSGWFSCAGERGSGLTVWRLLARWAARSRLPVDVALVATSGHEYENGGGERFIRERAPKPARTALWVHLGANVAARDWHERGPLLTPLPSADPQRFLLASPALLPSVRAAFAGQPGLEQAYPADAKQAAGELGGILQTGYDPVIGVFGAHRYHHTRADDLRCVSPALIPPVAEAFATVIRTTVGAA